MTLCSDSLYLSPPFLSLNLSPPTTYLSPPPPPPPAPSSDGTVKHLCTGHGLKRQKRLSGDLQVQRYQGEPIHSHLNNSCLNNAAAAIASHCGPQGTSNETSGARRFRSALVAVATDPAEMRGKEAVSSHSDSHQQGSCDAQAMEGRSQKPSELSE